VNIIYANLTKAELVTKQAEQEYFLWSYAVDSFKKSSLYLSNPRDKADRMLVACLYLDSYWDNQAKKTKIHDALGGRCSVHYITIY
jgi:hypothetical protein